MTPLGWGVGGAANRLTWSLQADNISFNDLSTPAVVQTKFKKKIEIAKHSFQEWKYGVKKI